MKKEELATILNGREYIEEVTSEESRKAKDSGLVVVFGASDDLCEFRGAIDDEIGAWNGTIVKITKDGILANRCDDEDCPYFRKIESLTTVQVNAIWDRDGYSWVIESNIPYATFDIMENGEKFCRGIVFDMADVT